MRNWPNTQKLTKTVKKRRKEAKDVEEFSIVAISYGDLRAKH